MLTKDTITHKKPMNVIIFGASQRGYMVLCTHSQKAMSQIHSKRVVGGETYLEYTISAAAGQMD